MIIIDDHLDDVTADEFAVATGWDPKPAGPVPGRGLRAGAGCPPRRRHGRRRWPRPNGSACRSCATTSTRVTALGPGTTTGRTLSTAAAPDPELIDRDGDPFRLSSLHGRKVLLVAWASY